MCKHNCRLRYVTIAWKTCMFSVVQNKCIKPELNIYRSLNQSLSISLFSFIGSLLYESSEWCFWQGGLWWRQVDQLQSEIPQCECHNKKLLLMPGICSCTEWTSVDKMLLAWNYSAYGQRHTTSEVTEPLGENMSSYAYSCPILLRWWQRRSRATLWIDRSLAQKNCLVSIQRQTGETTACHTCWPTATTVECWALHGRGRQVWKNI